MVFKSMPESPNVQWTSAISFTKTGVDVTNVHWMLAMWIILYTFGFIILHACAKELRIVFACLSVCQFVSLSVQWKKFL